MFIIYTFFWFLECIIYTILSNIHDIYYISNSHSSTRICTFRYSVKTIFGFTPTMERPSPGARYMQPEWLCPKVGWEKWYLGMARLGVNKCFLLRETCLYLNVYANEYMRICDIPPMMVNYKLVLGVMSYTSLIWGLVKATGQATDHQSTFSCQMPEDAVLKHWKMRASCGVRSQCIAMHLGVWARRFWMEM